MSITAALEDQPIAGIDASVSMIMKGGLNTVTRSLSLAGVNLNELLGSLSELAALLPALILRMLLASPYQQGRLRPFFRGFCLDFAQLH